MTDYAKKYVPIFLSADDERGFERKLKSTYSNLLFVDGDSWDNSQPPAKKSLADCRSSIVYLWNPDICPSLPSKALPNGKVRGPTSGVVIQFCRSTNQNGYLLSGDLGIGYDKTDRAILDLVKAVWKILSNMNAKALYSFNPTTGQVLEGDISD